MSIETEAPHDAVVVERAALASLARAIEEEIDLGIGLYRRYLEQDEQEGFRYYVAGSRWDKRRIHRRYLMALLRLRNIARDCYQTWGELEAEFARRAGVENSDSMVLWEIPEQYRYRGEPDYDCVYCRSEIVHSTTEHERRKGE